MPDAVAPRSVRPWLTKTGGPGSTSKRERLVSRDTCSITGDRWRLRQACDGSRTRSVGAFTTAGPACASRATLVGRGRRASKHRLFGCRKMIRRKLFHLPLNKSLQPEPFVAVLTTYTTRRWPATTCGAKGRGAAQSKKTQPGDCGNCYNAPTAFHDHYTPPRATGGVTRVM